MAAQLSKELVALIEAVSNKRARFVLDRIAKQGVVTTEEINKAGYDHPPRAARDVRELGFPLKTVRVKSSTGRPIAAYMLDPDIAQERGKSGRMVLPKKQRAEIIARADSKCHICGARHNLQVDHRIPYEVAGESQNERDEPYQVLCGSCNRKKSWDCEHCKNWRETKAPDICRTCYWAGATGYTHVATRQERRVEVVWAGSDVKQFERLLKAAVKKKRTVAEEVRERLNQKN